MIKAFINFFKYYNKCVYIKPEYRHTRGSIKGIVTRVKKDVLTLSVFDYGLVCSQEYNVKEVEIIR